MTIVNAICFLFWSRWRFWNTTISLKIRTLADGSLSLFSTALRGLNGWGLLAITRPTLIDSLLFHLSNCVVALSNANHVSLIGRLSPLKETICFEQPAKIARLLMLRSKPVSMQLRSPSGLLLMNIIRANVTSTRRTLEYHDFKTLPGCQMQGRINCGGAKALHYTLFRWLSLWQILNKLLINSCGN